MQDLQGSYYIGQDGCEHQELDEPVTVDFDGQGVTFQIGQGAFTIASVEELRELLRAA